MQERTKRRIALSTLVVFILLACSGFGLVAYDSVKGEEGDDEGYQVIPCTIKIKNSASRSMHVNFTFFKDWSREDLRNYVPGMYMFCYFHVECDLNSSQEINLKGYACPGFWCFRLAFRKCSDESTGFSGSSSGGAQSVPYDNPIVLTLTITCNGFYMSRCICGKASCPYS